MVAFITVLGAAASSPANAKPPAAPESVAALASLVAADSIPLSGNVVYVDFWASWCVPCRSSFPWMKALMEKYRARGLQVVTINVDRDPAAARKFLAEMKSSLPVVFDADGKLAKQYALEVMPTSFVYGRDGKLRMRHEGFRPQESGSLEEQIDTLLKENPAQ